MPRQVKLPKSNGQIKNFAFTEYLSGPSRRASNGGCAASNTSRKWNSANVPVMATNPIRSEVDSTYTPDTIHWRFLVAFLESNHMHILVHMLAQLILRVVSFLEHALLHLT